jgi:retron-type reverse transcriptase
VVQGSLKLILEPIFEADFQPGSFGYRPKKRAHEAIDRVAQAIVRHNTRVLDLDLRSYFDNVRHDRLLAKVAKRVDDDDVMHLLKIMLKSQRSWRPARRGDGSLNAKDNFRFERTIVGWRGQRVIDLRRKG